MTESTRRWLVALVVVAVISLGAIGVVGQATTQDMAAKVWAQGLDAGERVAAGRQFYALPAAFRKALLEVQTGSEKSVMARRLISGFLMAKPDLTPDQRAVLEEAYELLTPEFCSTVHASDPTGIGRRIMEIFPKEEAWLFVAPGGGVVGPQNVTSHSVLPLAVQAEVFISRHVAPTLYAGGDDYSCDCDVVQGTTICLEPIDRYCSELAFCLPSGLGCGIFHLFSCNNKCVQRINT